MNPTCQFDLTCNKLENKTLFGFHQITLMQTKDKQLINLGLVDTIIILNNLTFWILV